MITTEKDIEQLVRSDAWMMEVLQAAERLNLPDWWIGAGFLRNKVWDAIKGNEQQKSRDVDLVYYDHQHTDKETDVVADFRQPERIKLFRDRITNKQWRERWPHLSIIET